MTALLTALVTWLAANFDLPAIYDLPDVRFVPPAQISDLRYRDIATKRRRAVIAVYDDASRTIYLNDAWTGQSAEELSILVHEMVHHLQNLAGHRHPCPGARERLAYEAQERWLGLFGLSLAAAFELDPMTLKVSTACFHGAPRPRRGARAEAPGK